MKFGPQWKNTLRPSRIELFDMKAWNLEGSPQAVQDGRIAKFAKYYSDELGITHFSQLMGRATQILFYIHRIFKMLGKFALLVFAKHIKRIYKKKNKDVPRYIKTCIFNRLRGTKWALRSKRKPPIVPDPKGVDYWRRVRTEPMGPWWDENLQENADVARVGAETSEQTITRFEDEENPDEPSVYAWFLAMETREFQLEHFIIPKPVFHVLLSAYEGPKDDADIERLIEVMERQDARDGEYGDMANELAVTLMLGFAEVPEVDISTRNTLMRMDQAVLRGLQVLAEHTVNANANPSDEVVRLAGMAAGAAVAYFADNAEQPVFGPQLPDAMDIDGPWNNYGQEEQAQEEQNDIAEMNQ